MLNREDIIQMMNESCDADKVNPWENGFWTITQEELERFAQLVAAAERESCAKLIEGYGTWEHNHVLAKAIRARGQQ